MIKPRVLFPSFKPRHIVYKIGGGVLLKYLKSSQGVPPGVKANTVFQQVTMKLKPFP